MKGDLTLDPGGDGTGAPPIGLGEALRVVAQEVGRPAGEREQPLLAPRLRLDAAIGEDMACGDTLLGERARDQQETVAVERLALGAHQADAMAAAVLDQAVEAGTKVGGCRHRVVVDDAVAIELAIARAAAERLAERKIGNALMREPFGQRLGAEPGTPARERNRAHNG